MVGLPLAGLVLVLFLFSSDHCFGLVTTSGRWGHGVLRRAGSGSLSMASGSLGGKIVVTGLGECGEDEFTLNLLNEQSVWTSVVLAASDVAATQKRFLTRTARYGGLLNILDFASASGDDELKGILVGANAWLAFNVSQTSIPHLAEMALGAGVKRLVVTMPLAPQNINDTSIVEFDAAIDMFVKAGQGASFTGIRHGEIIPGDENNPYEIYNSTIPCLESTVERGVLGRVVTELLMIPDATNSQCGVSSSSAFAAAYLNILRSSGLSRRQEVTKLYQGGLQRVAQLTVAEYKNQTLRREDKAKRDVERKVAEAAEEAIEKARVAQAAMDVVEAEKNPAGIKRVTRVDPSASITPGWDEDQAPPPETDEQKISKRSEEILKGVWKEFEARMYSKTTSKSEFYDTNRQMARDLAEKELEEAKASLVEAEEEKVAKQRMLDRLVDVNRKQYNKLLTLERKEMQSQKAISDTWVKYVYLLLETTMLDCKKSDTLFHNLDEFGQTMLLRRVANDLRASCGLPAFDIVYDPLDAAVLVTKLADSPMGRQLGLGEDGNIDTILAALMSKYSETMKSVPALRGAAQIVDLAIETLKKELPPAPPSVNDLRREESRSKREVISTGRLDKIKNRGKPTDEGASPVGRM